MDYINYHEFYHWRRKARENPIGLAMALVLFTDLDTDAAIALTSILSRVSSLRQLRVILPEGSSLKP